MSQVSPFAYYLRELRQRRGLKQRVVAELLGYEQSYLSSLEKGLKGLPRRAFIDRLVAKLSLDEAEIAELERVLRLSDRRVLLPANASPAEYELWHDLKGLSGRLDSDQLGLIKSLLRVIAPQEALITAAPAGRAATIERRRAM